MACFHNPVLNYQKRFIKLGNGIIKVPLKEKKLRSEVMNMSVNECRRFLKQERKDP